MLILNNNHRLRAGVASLDQRCIYCSKALNAYPLIMSDDAEQNVYHAACAIELATEIMVDVYTFFSPPAPYDRLFVLRLFSNIGRSGQCLRLCSFKAQPHTLGMETWA